MESTVGPLWHGTQASRADQTKQKSQTEPGTSCHGLQFIQQSNVVLSHSWWVFKRTSADLLQDMISDVCLYYLRFPYCPGSLKRLKPARVLSESHWKGKFLPFHCSPFWVCSCQTLAKCIELLGLWHVARLWHELMLIRRARAGNDMMRESRENRVLIKA